MMDWQNYVTESQNSLRVLAELTGGYAAINQNDFTKALKRIDAETSDYYVIGYYSSNPDPTKKRRRIDVNVTRPNVSVLHRTDTRSRRRRSRGLRQQRSRSLPTRTRTKRVGKGRL